MNEQPTSSERLTALEHAHGATNDNAPEPPRNWLLALADAIAEQGGGSKVGQARALTAAGSPASLPEVFLQRY